MKKSGRISQMDIARKLGVHQNTISKALRDEPDISPKMKKKVLMAAQKLGYRSNRLANAIIRGKSTIIGVVFPQYHGNFFSQVLDSIEQEAVTQGYRVLLSRSISWGESTRSEVEFLLEYCVDGLIIATEAGKKDHSYYKSIIENGEKIVWINQKCSLTDTASIYSDDDSGMQQLIRYLTGLGHRHIAFCMVKHNQRFTLNLRKRRFTSYMKSRKLTPTCLTINSLNSIENDITAFLKINPQVTAFCCFTDGIALDIIQALRSLKIAVPDDMSVVGYGNNLLHAMHMTTPLTTIDQHPENMGKFAVNTLIDLMDGKSVPSEIRLSVDLIKRFSAKKI